MVTMTNKSVPLEVLADPWFHECLNRAVETDLPAEFDRLTGFSISKRQSPIIEAIDKATGFAGAGIQEFVWFVYETIYRCVPHPAMSNPARGGG